MQRQRQATTLVETIVALVLLAGSLLLVAALMQRTLIYQRRSETLLESASLADQVMDEVRQWARTPANYAGDWSYWNGRLVNSPNHPGLQARVAVQNSGLTLLSPDLLTERDRHPGDTRAMLQGSVLIRVLAGPDLASPVGRVQTWTLIAPPTPRADGARVEVLGAAGPLIWQGSRGYQARAYDGNNRELPPCCFEWRVRGLSGRASGSTPRRDGRSFTLSHNQTRWDDTLGREVAASGTVSVEAETRIMGQIVRGSSVVTLEPEPPPPP